LATDMTHLNAQLTIASNASFGPRNVMVTSGSEVVSLPAGFTVTNATNQAPVVSAGAPQTITLPGMAKLNGSVTDDKLPTGGVLTIAWSTVSGPGSVTFSNSH